MRCLVVWFFFFNDTATTEIYTLSLHDALPIYENYKNGMFRVFIVLSIPLELVTYFQYDLSFVNKFLGLTQITLFRCYYGEYEEEPTK